MSIIGVTDNIKCVCGKGGGGGGGGGDSMISFNIMRGILLQLRMTKTRYGI